MSESLDHRDVRLSPLERKQCSRCGAYCHNTEMSCWFCNRDFSQPSGEPMRPVQFSLATLFVVMTLTAVVLAIFLVSPPLAIILSLFCAGALVRMGILETVRAARGARRAGHFVLDFATSLGVVALAVFCWFIPLFLGFVMAAIRTDVSDFGLWSIGGGFLLGLIFAAWILWLTRRVPPTD